MPRPFLILALALSGEALAAGSFTPLQTPGLQITKVSDNGAYAVGLASDPETGYPAGVRWTAATGAEDLITNFDPGGINNLGTLAGAITVDGGSSLGGTSWGAYAEIGSDPTPFPSQLQEAAGGYDIADDGTVVGLSHMNDYTGAAIAFKWTAADGMTALTVNRPEKYSRANAISADGHVIVGWNDQDDGYRSAVIWTGGVPLDVVDRDGIPVGEAAAVNADGHFVVGSNYTNASGESGAWRWKNGDLQLIPGMTYAFGVSRNGGTVVGNTSISDNPPRAAMIWREGIGTVPFEDYLEEQGISLPDGWSRLQGGLTGISGDGRTIGGYAFVGIDTISFIVHIDAPVEDPIFADGFDSGN